jgi:ferredoxin
MADWRIESHPIFPVPDQDSISFTWIGQTLRARAGETIASALFANGIRIFGYHPKDGSPQGIFCANGQCAECKLFIGENRAETLDILAPLSLYRNFGKREALK